MPPRAARTKSVIRTLPIPYRGWNTRDQLTDMPPEYALTLENMYSEGGVLAVRKGYTAHATGLAGGNVDTFMVFDDSGTPKGFAATSDRIYDATSPGPVGAAAVTGLSNGRWDWVNFAAGGDNFLIAANAADGVRSYNGSWATESISGVTASDLKGTTDHKGRLWFIEDGTLSAWYLGAGAKAGAATEFPFQFRRGGTLAALASWSRDGGAGPDDYFLAISSSGEIAMYAGTDPSSASTWALVNRYNIPIPVGGTRCVLNVGADLIITTVKGIISMGEVVSGVPIVGEGTSAIEPTFAAAAAAYPFSTLWNMCWHTAQNRLIVNVPTSGGEAVQYVFCMETLSWSYISGINARCWAEAYGFLYFGGSGAAWQADTGYTDNGEAIDWEMTFSPSRFGDRGTKHWRRCRLHFMADGPVTPRVTMLSNYERPTNSFTSTAAVSAPAGATWDVSLWDVSYWGGSTTGRSTELALTGSGTSGALRVAGSTNGAEIALTGAEITMETARTL